MSSETDPDYQVDPTALARARTFQKAMKGWGTDEAALINLTASLRAEEIAPLRFAYVSSIGGDLVDEVKGETSGNFKAALAALLTPVPKYDANICREATQGFGTNEQVLIEVFCTRTLDELKDFSKCYFLTHIRYLETDLKAKLDGDFLELLLQRLTGTEEKGDIPGDVERLFFAKQDKDAAAFIPILCHRSSEYVRELNTAYANQHGASLATVIDESLSGDVKKALMAIVTPPADYFSELLYKAMKGFGTDDSTLIRVIASQRFRHLKDIAAVYLNRYGVSLKHAISDELSGDYKKLILAVLEFVLEGEIPAVL